MSVLLFPFTQELYVHILFNKSKFCIYTSPPLQPFSILQKLIINTKKYIYWILIIWHDHAKGFT